MADSVDASLQRLIQSGVLPSDAPTAPPNVDASLQRLMASGVIPKQQQPSRYDPSEGEGTLQFGPWDTGIAMPQGITRFLAGAGKGFSDLGTGAKQLATEAVGALPGVDLRDTIAAQRQAVDQQKQTDAPLMNTGAGLAGNVAAQVLPAITLPGGGASALARLAAATAGGAGYSAIQPVGADDSRTKNAVIGGALGLGTQGAANVVGALARPVKITDPDRQAAYDFATANGGSMSRGQMTGNPFTLRVEKMLAGLPGSRGFYQKLSTSQQSMADNLVNDITGGGAGNLINKFGQGKSVTLDDPFFGDMRNIGSNFATVADRDAPNGALKTVEQYVGTQTPNPALANFPASAKAQMIAQGVPEFVGNSAAKFQPGSQLPMTGPYGDFNNYWGLRSLYGTRSFGARDPADKAAYGFIQDALDNAATRSLRAAGEDPAALSQLRTAYSVEKTLQPARTVSPDGAVSYPLAKLGNLVAKKDAKQTSYLDNLSGDAGDTLRNLANFSRQAAPATSSGTAENAIAGKVATLEIMKDLLSGEGLQGLLGTASSIVAAPWVTNTALQATRNGIPGLRNISPGTASILRQIGVGGPQGLLGTMQGRQ